MRANRFSRAPCRYIGHKQDRFVIRSAFGGEDDAFVLSGSEDSQIYIWHRQGGQLLKVAPLASNPLPLFRRPPQPSYHKYVPLRVRNSVLTAPPCAQVLPGHSRSVNSVSCSPMHPNIFASASDDHTVWIWGPPQAQGKTHGLQTAPGGSAAWACK
jgi:WD40 repeat protein